MCFGIYDIDLWENVRGDEREPLVHSEMPPMDEDWADHDNFLAESPVDPPLDAEDFDYFYDDASVLGFGAHVSRLFAHKTVAKSVVQRVQWPNDTIDRDFNVPGKCCGEEQLLVKLV